MTLMGRIGTVDFSASVEKEGEYSSWAVTFVGTNLDIDSNTVESTLWSRTEEAEADLRTFLSALGAVIESEKA